MVTVIAAGRRPGPRRDPRPHHHQPRPGSAAEALTAPPTTSWIAAGRRPGPRPPAGRRRPDHRPHHHLPLPAGRGADRPGHCDCAGRRPGPRPPETIARAITGPDPAGRGADPRGHCDRAGRRPGPRRDPLAFATYPPDPYQQTWPALTRPGHRDRAGRRPGPRREPSPAPSPPFPTAGRGADPRWSPRSRRPETRTTLRPSPAPSPMPTVRPRR